MKMPQLYRTFLLVVIFICAFTGNIQALTVETGHLVTDTNGTAVEINPTPDSSLLYLNLKTTGPLAIDSGKIVVNDIQQHLPSKGNAVVLILLVVMLGALTYLKTAFGNDLDDLLNSVVNQNIAQQIFRAQTKEITFSSFILHVNFIVVMSLYVRYIFASCFHVSGAGNFSLILLINFLFTFFYLAKLAILKFIGIVFEVKDECDEYIFIFTTMCKTLGLALLPALFIFYTARGSFANVIFAATVIVCAAMLLILVCRGLSTAYRLLYRSVYHFFIYVCVVEISPIFLLFKLLTKTIT
jgi:hypothetical protein